MEAPLEAMLDDARWPGASQLIGELCGAKSNFLVYGDGATSNDVDIFFARFCFHGQRNAELERLYFDVYHSLDEWLPPRACGALAMAPLVTMRSRVEPISEPVRCRRRDGVLTRRYFKGGST